MIFLRRDFGASTPAQAVPVLRSVAGPEGGEASLADMHAHSERRYFIAHKRFSDLMESLVDDGLIDFDHSTGMATISSAGAELVSE